MAAGVSDSLPTKTAPAVLHELWRAVGYSSRFSLRLPQCVSLRGAASSTAPADRPYHLVDLRFFTVDGGIGAECRTFHRVRGARRRKRRAKRVSARGSGTRAKGTASYGTMRSHATAPGKRGGGRKANEKGGAKNGKIFHAETPRTRDLINVTIDRRCACMLVRNPPPTPLN